MPHLQELARYLRRNLAILSLVWILAIAAGMGEVWKHELSPGTAALPLSMWPAASRLRPPSNFPVLVMLAHPRCPCTRASIGELAMLMAQLQGRLDAHVLFYKPRNSGLGWEQTDLWASAQAIPGVQVTADENGLEARLFRATTSGQTVLYSASEQLLFSGGITNSRGHSGDNTGRSAIASLVGGGRPDQKRTLVFGCDLFGTAHQDRLRFTEDSADDTLRLPQTKQTSVPLAPTRQPGVREQAHSRSLLQEFFDPHPEQGSEAHSARSISLSPATLLSRWRG